MIQPSEYIKAKAAGRLNSIKLGGEFQLDVKRFSPEDGQEIAPVRHNIKSVELQNTRTLLVSELENLDIMIADLEALK